MTGIEATQDGYRIVIPIAPVTKKNHQQIVFNKKTGSRFVAPSPQYQQYEHDCGWFLKPLKDGPSDYPVNVKCLFYMPTNKRVDLNNLLESATDVLVRYSVLADDNSDIVAAHDGSRVFKKSETPRTEMYITRITEDESCAQ